MTYPWKVAGKACLIPVPFLIDGEPIVVDPTTSKVVEIYTPAGIVISPSSSTFDQGNSVLNVQIAAGDNTTTTPTTRQVEVEFPSLGYLFKATYKLTPRISSAISHKDILAFIGVNESEFPEQDADYVSAYWELFNKYPTLYGTNPIAADACVVAQTVLQSLNAVSNRLWTKNTDGSISVSRALNIEALEARARAQLGSSLAKAVPGLSAGELGTAFGATQILFATRVDPLTGI